jgi:hypothetical protein
MTHIGFTQLPSTRIRNKEDDEKPELDKIPFQNAGIHAAHLIMVSPEYTKTNNKPS